MNNQQDLETIIRWIQTDLNDMKQRYDRVIKLAEKQDGQMKQFYSDLKSMVHSAYSNMRANIGKPIPKETIYLEPDVFENARNALIELFPSVDFSRRYHFTINGVKMVSKAVFSLNPNETK